jgi:hypothetical protein
MRIDMSDHNSPGGRPDRKFLTKCPKCGHSIRDHRARAHGDASTAPGVGGHVPEPRVCEVEGFDADGNLVLCSCAVQAVGHETSALSRAMAIDFRS